MGLIKRPLYRPERKPARKRGVLQQQAPVGCPDANHYEIAMALYAICGAGKIKVGRGGEYNAIRDEYTVIGKDQNGKAQDLKIEGVAVAALIHELRHWNGVSQFDKHGLTRAVGGVG